MTGTNRVDVQFLHALDILQHPFLGNIITIIRIHFMTVRPFKQHRLAIYPNLRILHLNLAESHLLDNRFRNLSVLLQISHQRIEIRGLGRPLQRIADIHHYRLLTGTIHLRRSYLLSVFVQQLQVYYSLTLYLKVNLQRTVFVLRVQIRSNADILNMRTLTSI